MGASSLHKWSGQMCEISLFVTFFSFSFRFFITRTVWQYPRPLSTDQKHSMQKRTSTWWSLRDIRIPGATTRRRSSMSQNTHSSRDEVIRKSPLNRACKPHRKKSTLQHKTTDKMFKSKWQDLNLLITTLLHHIIHIWLLCHLPLLTSTLVQCYI